MEACKKKTVKRSVFYQMIEDQRAISRCIRSGGDLKKLAKERGIKFVKPFRLQ